MARLSLLLTVAHISLRVQITKYKVASQIHSLIPHVDNLKSLHLGTFDP